MKNARDAMPNGGTIVIGSIFIGINLLSDLLYRMLDPRTRPR